MIWWFSMATLNKQRVINWWHPFQTRKFVALRYAIEKYSQEARTRRHPAECILCCHSLWNFPPTVLVVSSSTPCSISAEAWITGWWFGLFFMTFHILGMSSSQLTNSNIFQRGRLKPPTRLGFHSWYFVWPMELEAKNNFVALNEAARPFYIIKAGHENGNTLQASSASRAPWTLTQLGPCGKIYCKSKYI